MANIVPSRNQSVRTHSTLLRTSRSESILPSIHSPSLCQMRSSSINTSAKRTSIGRDVGAYILKIQDRGSMIERWRLNVINERTDSTSYTTEAEPNISRASSVRSQLNRGVKLEPAPTDLPTVHDLHTQFQRYNIPLISLVPSNNTRAIPHDSKSVLVHPFQEPAKASSKKEQKIPIYAAPKMPAASESFTTLRKVELEMAISRSRRSYLRGQELI